MSDTDKVTIAITVQQAKMLKGILESIPLAMKDPRFKVVSECYAAISSVIPPDPVAPAKENTAPANPTVIKPRK